MKAIRLFTPFQTTLSLIRNVSFFKKDKDKDKVKFRTGPVSLRPRRGGFTLVELLIVIAILAILAAAVVIVINPGEMMAQARDAERISSIESLKKSIDLFILDNPSAPLGTSQTVYISLPDASSSTCGSISLLPTLPSGWSYHCVTAANLRKTDSTGWIPLNFGNIYGGSPVSSLPIDPVNDSASGKYYTYVMGGSYELTALMEAEKTTASISDGGSLTGVFEAGTDLSLTPPTRDKGLVGYWTFDGTGSIANNQTTALSDSSGKGNNGTASNVNGTGMSFVTGKKGNAVSFDGVDDYIRVGNAANIHPNNGITIEAWINQKTIATGDLAAYSKQIFGEYGAGGVYKGYALCLGVAKVTPLFGNGVNDWQTFSGSTTYSLNNWHHVAMTFKANGKGYAYLDGQVDGSYNTGNLFPDNDTKYIGSTYRSFDGFIDELRVYDRALSASEIKAIYDATK